MKLEIDYSQLSSYITCPKKYYNRYVLNLAKIKYDEREVDKDFGGAVHKALELIYKGKTVEEAKQAFREGYTGIETDKIKTPAHGEKLIDEYVKYWQSSPSELADKNFTVLAVEQVDKYQVGAVTYVVKIDLIVKNNAGIWIVDHKTSTKLPYNYFYQFSPNMQVSGYCNYAQHKFGQCSGMIINLITVGYRENKYKGEPAGFHCQFVRDIVNRTPDQLKDFEYQVNHWCAKLDEDIVKNRWLRNEGACHNFKGCAYKELCVSCDDSEIQSSLYEVKDNKEYLK